MKAKETSPPKHWVRLISEACEQTEQLYGLDVDKHLRGLSDWTIARYAKRLAARPPSVGARIKAPTAPLVADMDVKVDELKAAQLGDKDSTNSKNLAMAQLRVRERYLRG